MSLQVIAGDTNSHRDVDRFIELQFILYQDCGPMGAANQSTI